MNGKVLAIVVGALFLVGIIAILITKFGAKNSTSPASSTFPADSQASESSQASNSAEGNNMDSNAPFKILSGSEIEDKKVLIVTPKGNIEIELFAQAPIASSNFISLISKKFYDGLTFHRRVEGFVIQGGDPSGNGTGGPGYNFKDELVTKDYKRGIVAMANSGPNTNGSQFFIMLADNPLPKQYTIFGQVLTGMEVVDKIQIGDKMTSVSLK